MNRFAVALTTICLFICSAAYAEKSDKLASKYTVRYRLTDLGESTIPLNESTSAVLKLSLAPKLNNSGEVIANRKSGGFLRRANGEFFTPHIPNAIILFHALNADGDLLVSVDDTKGKVEWAIWGMTGQGSLSERKTLPTTQIKDRFQEICFCEINDKKMVSGYFLNKNQVPQIVVWNHETQKIYSPTSTKKALLGTWQGLNNNGRIYGFFQEQEEFKPAVWNETEGLIGLKNYRSRIIPEGNIMMESLAMTDDGVAYGTYWVKYKDDNPIVAEAPKVYYNFAWEPGTGAFKQLDIDGMYVAKANNHHTLIGSISGKPAICGGGQKPIEFSSLIHPDQQKEWEIIQLSDINDSDSIVGIGKSQGSVHFFYAEPLLP